MAEPAEQLRMALAEFLDWDDGTDTRYELIDGQVVAMAPPREAHGTIVMNLGLALAPSLKAPCRMVVSAGIAQAQSDDRFYVADLAVTCDEAAPQRPFLPEPRLIIEVLSRSTAAHDRGRKGEDYRRIPSVQEVLFVSSDERRAVLWRREAQRWVIEDFIGEGSVRLTSIDALIPLAAVYASVDFGEAPAEQPD